MQIWDTDAARKTRSIDYLGFSANRPIVSHDGRFVATFGGGGVFLIDTRKWTYAAKMRVKDNINVEVLRFSPDSTFLLGGDRLGNLRRFDLPKLQS